MRELQEPLSANTPIQQKYEMGLRIAQAVCSIVTMPIEYALRPHFGTRYFDPIQALLSWAFMLCLPLFGIAGDAGGLLGLGMLSGLFFASHLIHGPRTWRRMIHMERENHSEYEGEALPIFARLPYGERFWMVRVVYEPVLVVAVAIVFHGIAILDRASMIYLVGAALFLALKNCLFWYQSWLHLRLLMDAKFAGPLVAKAACGNATEKELAQIHLAGFPKSVPADVRTAAIVGAAARMPTLPANVTQLISPVEPDVPRVANPRE